MEYKRSQDVRIPPRIILHGGAGNISRATMTPERRRAYHAALLEIISRTETYIQGGYDSKGSSRKPSSLETATFAVVLLEDNPLFNCGRGAVFTRDGINELEAGVMVSHGRAKRGVGVTGLRRVRNPILLARRMLEHGDEDLAPAVAADAVVKKNADGLTNASLNVPSAQGHTLVHGAAAEALATQYGLPLVDPSYFFTQARWDEHEKALQKEHELGTASYSPDAYLPQGTVGAVALGEDGVLCCATSTGGLTNKLTGRIGDTPIVGAGSWAASWAESSLPSQTAPVQLSDTLRSLLGDCLPVPRVVYSPVSSDKTTTTRSLALSGTGNGDSFIRVSAAHTIAALAQYRPLPAADALFAVAGRGGLLEQSARDRWGRTGEGQGGLIGIESEIVRDVQGRVVDVRSAILQNCNCGGLFRAWIDEYGHAQVRIFRDDFDRE